jgi:hypothetical protein
VREGAVEGGAGGRGGREDGGERGMGGRLSGGQERGATFWAVTSATASSLVATEGGDPSSGCCAVSPMHATAATPSSAAAVVYQAGIMALPVTLISAVITSGVVPPNRDVERL